MVIAVPTGIKIFSWIATMWGGSLALHDADAVGRSASSSCSPSAASPAWCWPMPASTRALHDTYYVVAHFHYVLSLGAMFGDLRRLLLLDRQDVAAASTETLGKIHFWLTFIGVNLTFFPQHFLGLAGMPRRIPDYPDAFAGWNMVSSIGSFIARGQRASSSSTCSTGPSPPARSAPTIRGARVRRRSSGR